MSALSFDIFARDHASGTFNKVGHAADQSGSKLKKFGKVAGLAAAASAAGIAVAGRTLWDWGQKASDLSETQSKVTQIFGKESTAALNAFASSAAKTMGQSRQSALDAAATFGVFGKSAGLSGEKLVGFSSQMTALSSDMASFSNTSPEEAIEAIGSALRGEAEPMRKYGVLLDDATLRNRALKLGLIETTKQALTPQQKVLAAQAEILRQTKDAQGDFARTSDGLANQQRILKARFEDVTAAVGKKVMPIMLSLVTWLLDKGMPAIEGLSGFLTKKVGPAFGSVGDWIKQNLIPVVSRIVSWFRDELAPVVAAFYRQYLPALGKMFSKVKGSMGDLEPFFRLLQAAAKALWAGFSKLLMPALGKVAKVVLPALGTALSLIVKAIGKVSQAAIWLWNKGFQPALSFIMKGIAGLMDIWAKMLHTLGKAPGFGWAKGASKAMADAADKARGLGDSIQKIPNEKRVNIRVVYSQMGRPGKELPAFARGTSFAPGGLARVGELGEEIVELPRGSKVIPNHRIAEYASQRASAPSSNGSGVEVNFNGPVYTTDVDELARVQERRMRQALAVLG